MQVMTDMQVNFAVCQFEADREIAILANQFQCPVVGQDSDFYVLDIAGGYIPFSYLKWRSVRKNENDEQILWAHIYHIDSLCRIYGVNKEMLPLFCLTGRQRLCGLRFSAAFLIESRVWEYGGDIKNRVSNLKELLTWLSNQTSTALALKEVFTFFNCETLRALYLAIHGKEYDVEGDLTENLKSFFEGNLRRSRFPEDVSVLYLLSFPCVGCRSTSKGYFSHRVHQSVQLYEEQLSCPIRRSEGAQCLDDIKVPFSDIRWYRIWR